MALFDQVRFIVCECGLFHWFIFGFYLIIIISFFHSYIYFAWSTKYIAWFFLFFIPKYSYYAWLTIVLHFFFQIFNFPWNCLCFKVNLKKFMVMRKKRLMIVYELWKELYHKVTLSHMKDWKLCVKAHTSYKYRNFSLNLSFIRTSNIKNSIISIHIFWKEVKLPQA